MARQAVIDPVEARAFSEELRAAIQYYSRVIDRVEAHVGRLGRTWQDAQFEEFAEEVKTLKRGLGEYIEASRDADQWLQRLAEEAENYQRHTRS